MGKSDFAFYEKDGCFYDRITHVLDYFQPPELVAWKLRNGKSETKKLSTIALKIGTEVDNAIKGSLLSEASKTYKFKTRESESCWEAYRRWYQDFAPSLSIGETVFSDYLLVAGTPDILWNDTVIDIKCSSKIRDTYWLQTEFYGRCLNFSYKAILRLDKNLGQYEYKTIPLNVFHWDVVRGLIHAFRYFNKPEDKKSEEICQQPYP